MLADTGVEEISIPGAHLEPRWKKKKKVAEVDLFSPDCYIYFILAAKLSLLRGASDIVLAGFISLKSRTSRQLFSESSYQG